MVFVFQGQDRNKHPLLFSKLFKLRHDVFVRFRGWSLPCKGGKEIDQYDTDDAFYLVDFDEHGEIVAHARVNPTTTASLTADYFPHLVENGAAIRSPSIYEATRFMVLPTQRDKSRQRIVKAQFLTGAAEWLMSQGGTHLQTVIDAGTLASYVEISPLVTPLGLAHPFGGGKGVPGGGECLVFRLPMCDALLDDIREYGGLARSSEKFWQPLESYAA